MAIVILLLILAAIVSSGARNVLSALITLAFGCLLLMAGCAII